MATDATNREAAEALAEALGNLPLALEQAAAYTEQAGISLAQYLELFRERAAAYTPPASPSADYPDALAVTFDIAFARLREASPAAANLVTLCAFLAPDDVPLEIFKEGFAAGILSNAPVAAATLQAYALAKVRGESFLSMHRLTQAVARDRPGDGERKEWAEAAVTVMQTAFQFNPDDTRTWPPSARLLQHALTAVENAGALGVGDEPAMILLNYIGMYLCTNGELDKARAVLEKSAEICERLLGPTNSELAMRLNNLGETLRLQGKPDEAAEYLKRALAIDEEVLGPSHPNVAVRLNNMGNVLNAQGAYSEAREYYERALAIAEANPDTSGLEIATLLNNIGTALYAEGDLKGACSYYERALPRYEEKYGTDHPNVATGLSNLGAALLKLGELDRARQYLERALKILLEHFDEKHPSTLVVRHHIEALDKRAAGESSSE